MQTVELQEQSELDALVGRAQAGEDVVFTRNGEPVAHLVPQLRKFNAEAAQAATLRIRARAKELNLGPFDWEEYKKLRDEGRR